MKTAADIARMVLDDVAAVCDRDLPGELAVVLAEGYEELEATVTHLRAALARDWHLPPIAANHVSHIQAAPPTIEQVAQSVRSFLMLSEAADCQLPCPDHEVMPSANCRPCTARLGNLRRWLWALANALPSGRAEDADRE